MLQLTPILSASDLRCRAARIRLLAKQIGEPRYLDLMLDAASAYERGAMQLEAKSDYSSPRYVSAAE